MPTNKNALLRYKILDQCFSNFHRQYTFLELVDKVNEALYDMCGSEVSPRQIREDIKHMRDRLAYDAPIKAYPYLGKKGRKHYYRYEDPNYSIFDPVLSTKELAALQATIDMLSRFRGGNNVWLEEVISNLECRFGDKHNAEKVVSFEQNEKLKGLEFLGDLIENTVHHQPLRIRYRSYHGNEHNTIVHPYLLKQYNSRWFLFGLEETEEGHRLTNKALDRIEYYSRVDTTFIPNTEIDFSKYFHDIIGVTVPNDYPEPENIVLKFDAARFPYIVSKPIHHSQIVLSEEGHTIQINVRPNKELETKLFSFGPDVEVVSPEWLRQLIKEKIANTLQKYSPE